MAVVMTITLDDAGRVSVNGPLENQILCYGLLEAGRDAIHAHCLAMAAALVKPPSEADMLALRRKVQ